MICCIVCRGTERIHKTKGRLQRLASRPLPDNGFHEKCFEAMRHAIREADIVVGVDPKTRETLKVIHGEALLQLIASRLEDSRRFKVAEIPIDLSKDDLEQVAAACQLEGKE